MCRFATMTYGNVSFTYRVILKWKMCGSHVISSHNRVRPTLPNTHPAQEWLIILLLPKETFHSPCASWDTAVHV